APAGGGGPPAQPPPAPRPARLRPAPGQELFGQRFAWTSAGPAARERTTEGGSGSSPRGSTPPQTGQAQVRRSVADGTHRGLPRRVRQANLAPQLRDRGEPATPPADERPVRSPQEIRTMMASLPDGWQRGRVDHLDLVDDGPGDWPGGAPGGTDGGASS